MQNLAIPARRRRSRNYSELRTVLIFRKTITFRASDLGDALKTNLQLSCVTKGVPYPSASKAQFYSNAGDVRQPWMKMLIVPAKEITARLQKASPQLLLCLHRNLRAAANAFLLNRHEICSGRKRKRKRTGRMKRREEKHTLRTESYWRLNADKLHANYLRCFCYLSAAFCSEDRS